MPPKGPKTVANFLPTGLLRTLGTRLDDVQRLQLLWQKHAGDALARHSEPLSYAGGELHLRVDGPVWASRLRQQEHALVEQLRREPSMYALRSLRVRVTPRASETPEPPPRGTPARANLSPKNEKLLRGVADDIRDTKLRDALRRLAQRDPSR